MSSTPLEPSLTASVIALLQARGMQDVRAFRPETLAAAIGKRISATGAESQRAYLRRLKQAGREIDDLRDELLKRSAAAPPDDGMVSADWAPWLLVDNCGSGIVVIDSDSKLRYYNSTARDEQALDAEHLGLSLAETPLVARFDGLAEDVAALNAEPLVDDTSPAPGERAVSARQRVLQTDDGLSWLLRVARLRAPPRLIIVSMINVTPPPPEAAELGASVIEAGDAESATRTTQLASLGTLAAGIAHEINNPLNAIMMNAELGLVALEGEPDAVRLRRALDTIIEDVKRCAGLTASVLKLSRKGASAKAAGDFNEIVRAARRLVDAELQMRDATIELELADLPPLPLDVRGMESAVVNLLTNAASSAERGVAIKVESWCENEEVVLRVTDTGAGIPESVLEHIFDPFFTTRQGDRGTGLGLSLVHATVTEHGGTINVGSTFGQGTTAVVRLPFDGNGDRR